MKEIRKPSDGNDEKIWEPGAALETSDGRENDSRNQQVTFEIWKPEQSCPLETSYWIGVLVCWLLGVIWVAVSTLIKRN